MITTDESWALARTIQLTPATDVLQADHHGVITALPHPTGWFISARYRPDLSPAHFHDFAEFVRVRTYLLLTEGPSATTWEPDGAGAFRAACVATDVPQEWIAA